MSGAAKDRHKRLLADLAAEGASRCCYLPGAGNPELWPASRCDCKFIPGFAGAAKALLTGEHTGCCEMRAAYWLLHDAESDS